MLRSDFLNRLLRAKQWLISAHYPTANIAPKYVKIIHLFNPKHSQLKSKLKSGLHSAIKFITPAQRHAGRDEEILTNRKEVYKQAESKNPNRWRSEIRNWDSITEVYLNPENKKIEEKEAA